MKETLTYRQILLTALAVCLLVVAIALLVLWIVGNSNAYQAGREAAEKAMGQLKNPLLSGRLLVEVSGRWLVDYYSIPCVRKFFRGGDFNGGCKGREFVVEQVTYVGVWEIGQVESGLFF